MVNSVRASLREHTRRSAEIMKIPLIVFIGIVAMSTTGCVLKYRDVSEQQKYQRIVGAEFITKDEFVLSGVNAPPGYSNALDFYLVHPLSANWSGPELITRQALPVGTRFIVLSVRQPTNILARDSINLLVRFVNFQAPLPVAVFVRLSNLTPIYVDQVSPLN